MKMKSIFGLSLVTTVALSTATITNAQVLTPEQQNSIYYSTKNSPKPWQSSSYLKMPKSDALIRYHQAVLEKGKTFISPLATGGGDLGGGNALVCNQNGNIFLKILDIHEAEINGLNLDLGTGASFQEKLDFVFDRMKKVSPVRAEVYRSMAKDILLTETAWVEDSVLPAVKDVNVVVVPHGCVLALGAVQRPIEQRKFPNVKFYIFNKDAFALLDEDSKAALILHEVLYTEARYSGLNTSDFVRDLVGTYLSPDVQNIGFRQLNKIYDDNGMNCTETSVPTLILKRAELTKKENIFCQFIGKSPIYISGSKIKDNFSWEMKGTLTEFARPSSSSLNIKGELTIKNGSSVFKSFGGGIKGVSISSSDPNTPIKYFRGPSLFESFQSGVDFWGDVEVLFVTPTKFKMLRVSGDKRCKEFGTANDQETCAVQSFNFGINNEGFLSISGRLYTYDKENQWKEGALDNVLSLQVFIDKNQKLEALPPEYSMGWTEELAKEACSRVANPSGAGKYVFIRSAVLNLDYTIRKLTFLTTDKNGYKASDLYCPYKVVN
jgi:hypothetical protein